MPSSKDDSLAFMIDHAVGIPDSALSAEAMAAAKTFILDSFGVAVAGSSDPWSQRLPETAAAWGAGSEVGVWGRKERLPAGSGALVNAHFMHCMEFDCVHEPAVAHVMTVVLATAMAWAERQGGVSGKRLLAAVAVGVDIAGTVGEAAAGAMKFFRPANAGGFGAVAATGRLAGLDAEGMRRAFGILYSQMSGTLQPHDEGSPMLALQMGLSARAALTAVDMAAAGCPAPLDVLTGVYGYYTLFEDGHKPFAPLLDRLGREWQVTRLSHKPYPSGRLTHGGVEGLLRLKESHGFGHEDVAEVVVTLPPLAERLVGRPDVEDPDPAYARLCLPFVAAVALRHGTVDVPYFSAEGLRDPILHELAARIRIAPLAMEDQNALVPQIVSVRLHDGSQHETRLEILGGHPDAPLSEAQHLAKFHRNWGYGVTPMPPEQGEHLIEAVGDMENLSEVRDLTVLLRP